MRPPRIAERLLRQLLPEGAARASVPGDLEEEFRELARGSRARAILWYWSQTFRVAARFLVYAAWRLVRARASRPGSAERRRNGMMSTLLREVRYAIRSLRRSPAFALTAIATLGLGIGAAVAVFSVVYGVLLKPFEYDAPDRLAVVWTSSESFPQSWLSGPEVSFIRENARTIEGIAALWPEFYTLTGGGPAEQLRGGDATPELFGMLGVEASLGRTLQAGDDMSGARVVVLSDALWRTRYGGARDVVGRTMTLDGEPYTIVGVMPPDFVLWLPEDGLFHERPDVWLPLRMEEWPNQDNHSLLAVVRLRAGVGWPAFVSELDALSASFRRSNVGEVAGSFGFLPQSLHDDVVAEARPTLTVLFGAVGFVLLLVCANIANLLLARGGERSGEMAVRCAVGAGRWALVRQLLAESVVISVAGGVLGGLIAMGALSLIMRFAPPDLPRMSGLSLDAPVLGFAAALSLLTTILFGLAPAVQASGHGVASVLRTSGRGASSTRASARHRAALVVGQFALAFVLLMSAGLLIRSLVSLRQVDPGFSAEAVLTMQLRLPSGLYPDAAARIDGFVEPVLASLSGLPAASAAGVVSALPFTEDYRGGDAWVEGDDGTRRPVRPVDIRFADGGYFDAMSAQLVGGRAFDSRDRADAPAVVIVDDAFAELAWPGQDPIGRTVAQDSAMTARFEVVGVVRHINHYALDEQPRAQVYYPALRNIPPLMSFTIGFAGPAQPVAEAARAAIQRIDPQVAVTRVTTMRGLVDASLSTNRFQTFLFTVFGGIALVLAAVGIYGVTAFGVARRRREFGVRLALGARPLDVHRMVVRSGLRMALIGLTIGVAGALGTSRLLERFLFGIRPTDAVTMAVVAVTLIAVALIAAYLPARSATRENPVSALRTD